MSNSIEATPSKNPTELLQNQVILLRNIEISLSTLQTTQVKMLESLSGLYEINKSTVSDGAEVFIENINMPFWSMVGLLVKLSIASIPAAIIILVLGTLAWLIIGGFLIGLIGALS